MPPQSFLARMGALLVGATVLACRQPREAVQAPTVAAPAPVAVPATAPPPSPPLTPTPPPPMPVESPAPGTLGGPRTDLTAAELEQFRAGRAHFFRVYDAASGLGPLFNDVSCAACHSKPVEGGGASLDHHARIAPIRGDVDVVPRRALPGFQVPQLPAGGVVGINKPPPLYGLGLLEAIPDEVLIQGCDPDDKNGDGVRGKVNVNGFHNRPGRFGFKAHATLLRDFIANALSMEMGVTNAADRDPRHARDGDRLPDPEEPAAVVDQMAAYVRGLAPPPRDGTHPAGEALFQGIGCTACHRPETGPGVMAFTDLCVHSLGPTFDNGIPDFLAKGDEFRTAPLWGLRLRTRFFHDDRAQSLDEAIRMHGGEAQGARDRYVALPEPARADLQAFLKTL